MGMPWYMSCFKEREEICGGLIVSPVTSNSQLKQANIILSLAGIGTKSKFS